MAQKDIREILNFWPPFRPNLAFDDHGWLQIGTAELLKDSLSSKTQMVLELGAWYGLSTRKILEWAPEGLLATIDHWCGSAEHLNGNEFIQSKLPQMFEHFIANCWDYRHRLLPIRMNTVIGMKLLHHFGFKPDLVYVDASHDYESVKLDLDTILMLFPKAIIVGDDWNWAGIKQAVTETAAIRGLRIEVNSNGWRMK